MRFSRSLSTVTLSLGAVAFFGACDSPTNPDTAIESALAEAKSPNASDRATGTLRADLGELNESGAAGQATLRLKGDILEVTLTARGLSANLPHAQHIHIGQQNICPRPEDDFNGDDDLLNTVEGFPAYGGVRVSLTTSGDASAGSGLAVERFPVANNAGVVTYRRDIDLSEIEVDPSEVADGVIVVHGISSLFGEADVYDGEQESSLAPGVPLEVTIPALCGELSAPGNGNNR